MIAGEGWPWLIVVVIIGLLVARFAGVLWASPAAVLGILLFLLFRDPGRSVPPLPLAVLAPIDGRVTVIAPEVGQVLTGARTRISIKTNHFGAYTIRAPIEGAVMDVREAAQPGSLTAIPSGMWVRSEEQDDVVLLFPGDGRGLAPKAFVRYGERVGQGQRFAYLRLASHAEVYVPGTAIIRVSEGDQVRAGITILAELAPQDAG